MRSLSQFSHKFEEEQGQKVVKISLAVFLVSFLVGFSAGLVFREIRLDLLTAKQRAQKIEEVRRMETLLQKFSQVQSSPLFAK